MGPNETRAMKHLEDQGIPADLAKDHSRVAWARLNDALLELARPIVNVFERIVAVIARLLP